MKSSVFKGISAIMIVSLGSCMVVYGLPSPNSVFSRICGQNCAGYDLHERAILRRYCLSLFTANY